MLLGAVEVVITFGVAKLTPHRFQRIFELVNAVVFLAELIFEAANLSLKRSYFPM